MKYNLQLNYMSLVQKHEIQEVNTKTNIQGTLYLDLGKKINLKYMTFV